MKRVLLTTGGTGGHIFPALAVAEELRRRDPGVELLFMGSLYGPERRLAERAGVPFQGLEVRGVLGRGAAAAKALALLALALPKAIKTVRRFSPDCAAGFGSYAAFAPLAAARLLGVPAVLHEQNAVAGVTNRLMARLCGRVCVSLPGTRGFGERELALTGNPVRAAIFEAAKSSRSGTRRRLLVVGGSLGAHALNEAMAGLAPKLRERGISVWHQTGPRDEAMVRAAYEAAGAEARVEAFVDGMREAYEWADLALCRAGASTVAELCGAGLPSVLVPFPFAAHDHQTFNARALEARGAARLVPQSRLAPEGLLALLEELLASPKSLEAMSERALSLAAPGAAAGVADQLEAAAQGRKR